uniref:Ecto-NOX disulfide-thiol exchanger 2 n=1 Tax=Caenorhabditis tropicalis TaxID=1561998 RepID=A0A1I7U1X2_9PELO
MKEEPQAAKEDQDPSQPEPSGFQAPLPFSIEELLQDQSQPGPSTLQAPEPSSAGEDFYIDYFKNHNQESLGVPSISSIPGFLSPSRASTPAAVVQQMVQEAVITFFSYY